MSLSEAGSGESRWDAILNRYISVYFSLFSFGPLLNFARRYFLQNNGVPNSVWRDAMFVYSGGLIVLLILWGICRKWGKRSQKECSFGEDIKTEPALKFLLAFSLSILVSTLFRGFSYIDVWGTEKSRTGLVSTFCYLCYFISGLFLIRKDLQKVITCLLASGTGCVLLMVIDRYLLQDALGTFNGSMLFYNRNDLSCWLTILCLCAASVVLLCSKRRQKIPAAAAYFIFVIGLILSDSMGYLIAAVFGILFAGVVLILTKRRKWKEFVLILILTAGAYGLLHIPTEANKTVQDTTSGNIAELAEAVQTVTDLSAASTDIASSRFILWQTALDSICEHPLFGVSRDISRSLLTKKAGNSTVHNAYLSYAMDYGIPAAVFYLGFVFCVFLRGARHRKDLTDIQLGGLIVAFGYFIGIFFGYHIFYTTPFAMLALGLGYYRQIEDIKPAKKKEKESAPHMPEQVQVNGISQKVDIEGLVKYAEEKGVQIEQLTKEELSAFLK